MKLKRVKNKLHHRINHPSHHPSHKIKNNNLNNKYKINQVQVKNSKEEQLKDRIHN